MPKVPKILKISAWLVGLLLFVGSCFVSYLAYTETEEVAGCVDGKPGRWHREVSGDAVIVFVHGILGHSNSTWCAESAADGLNFWPERILKDRPNVSVYLAGYDTRITSTQYSTEFIAKDIWDQLIDRNASSSGKRVIDKQNIIFVMHSMGGIVIRKLLVNRRDEVDLRNKCIGLMFYASPHGGSFYGTILALLALVRGNVQAWQLGLFSDALDALDNQFRELIDNPGALKLFGAEVAEEAFVEMLWGFLPLPPVVSADSALQYFPHRQRMISGTNHFNIVKPTDNGHRAHDIFLRFHDMLVNDPDRRSEVDDLLAKASKNVLAGRYAEAELALVRARNCIDYRVPTQHAIRGRMALQRDRIDDATVELRKAVDADHGSDEFGHALAKLVLGDILYREGDTENANKHYVDAQRFFERHDGGVSAKGRIERIRLALGKFQPDPSFDNFLAPGPSGSWAPPESAALALIHAEDMWYNGEYPEAANLLGRILDRVPETDFPKFVAEVRLTLAQVYTIMGSYEKAHEQVAAARSILENIENVRGLGIADLSEGKIHLSGGEIEKASKVLSKAIKRLAGRDEWHLASARERMAGIEIRRARFGPAEILLGEVSKFFDKLVKEKRSSAQVFFRLALLKFANRDHQETAKLLEKSINRYKDLPDSRGVMRASWARGEISVATGKVDEAKRYLKAAEHASEAEVSWEPLPHFQVLRGGIAFLENDLNFARDQLTSAAITFENHRVPPKAAEARLKLAIVLGAQERLAQAAKELDKSQKLFESDTQIFGLARIELVRACILGEPPTQVSKRLMNASEAFQYIGLWRWVDKVDDLIQASADGNLVDCGLGIVTNIG